MFNCGAVELGIPAPVGVAKEVNATEPRLEGRHQQVAVIFAAEACSVFTIFITLRIRTRIETLAVIRFPIFEF
jgi:hypothetical protein